MNVSLGGMKYVSPGLIFCAIISSPIIEQNGFYERRLVMFNLFKKEKRNMFEILEQNMKEIDKKGEEINRLNEMMLSNLDSRLKEIERRMAV